MSNPALRFRVVIAAAVIGAALTATGCAPRSSGRGRAVSHRWLAPASADERTNPLTANSAIVAGGARVFGERCAACHGATAEGTTRAPDLTTSNLRRQSDGAIFWKVSVGRVSHGMPTFRFLPEAQRWQLVLHLRALQAAK